MTERRTSSISPNVSPSMIVPKREPIENDLMQNNKRRFGEHLSHDTEIAVSNKRQMATKKHQHPDHNQPKITNGRNGNIDEQQAKQMESSLSLTTQKLFPNGGNVDTSSPPNLQSKPR